MFSTLVSGPGHCIQSIYRTLVAIRPLTSGAKLPLENVFPPGKTCWSLFKTTEHS